LNEENGGTGHLTAVMASFSTRSDLGMPESTAQPTACLLDLPDDVLGIILVLIDDVATKLAIQCTSRRLDAVLAKVEEEGVIKGSSIVLLLKNNLSR
jgi:hypothetical protein